MNRRLGPLSLLHGAFRKAGVAALLVLLAFAFDQVLMLSEQTDAPALSTIGLAMITALAAGAIAERFHLPAVVGYFATGLLLGPPLGDLLPVAWRSHPLLRDVLRQGLDEHIQPVATLLLGLIVASLGARISRIEWRKLSPTIPSLIISQAVVVVPLTAALIWGAIALPLGIFSLSAGANHAALFSAITLGSLLAISGAPVLALAVSDSENASGSMSDGMTAGLVLKELFILVVLGSLSGWLTSTPEIVSPIAWLLATMSAGWLGGSAFGWLLSKLKRDRLLIVIGTVGLACWLASQLHVTALPMLLVAGWAAAKRCPETLQLASGIKKLSTPAYLIVFLTAGLLAETDTLLPAIPLGLALAAVRFGGTKAGALLAHRLVPNTDQRFWWTALVPQGGILLWTQWHISGLNASLTPVLHVSVLSMLIADLLGPVLYRRGLERSGELGQASRQTDNSASLTNTQEESAPPPSTRPVTDGKHATPWKSAPTQGPMPWDVTVHLRTRVLNEAIEELVADARVVVRDVEQGPIDSFRKQALGYVRDLRRELLLYHRHVNSELVGREADVASKLAAVRTRGASLAERWGELALARRSVVDRAPWRPTNVLEQIDELLGNVPEFIEARYEHLSYRPVPDETLSRKLWRLGRTAVRKATKLTGGSEPTRSVALASIARYHLAGHLSTRLEGVAALLLDAERQVVDRSLDLFDATQRAYEHLAESAAENDDADQLREQLANAKQQWEQDISVWTDELERIAIDGSARIAHLLGTACADVIQDAKVASTHDLPSSRRRFGLVAPERAQAWRRMEQEYPKTRASVAAQYALLAAELELAAMRARIEDAVITFARDLGRTVEGRGHLQTTRVADTLRDMRDKIDSLFQGKREGDELAEQITHELKQVGRVTGEALKAAVQLQQTLADEHGLESLLDAIRRATTSLSAKISIPLRRPPRGEWRMPTAVPVVPVDFHQLVTSHIDTKLVTQVVAIVRRTARDVQPLASFFEQVQKRIALRLEVAAGELNAFEGAEPPAEVRSLVREMLGKELTHSLEQTAEFEQLSRAWAQTAERGVLDGLIGGLTELRWSWAEGKFDQRGLLSNSSRGLRTWWTTRSQQLAALLAKTRHTSVSALRSRANTPAVRKLREHLGLPVDHARALTAGAFSLQHLRDEPIPLVYRRIFSPHALDAADLLYGREQLVSSCREALSKPQGSGIRAAVIVGPDGAGKGAVAQAVVRQMTDRRVDHVKWTAPVDPHSDWSAQLDQQRSGHLVVISGLHWLVSPAPGGLAPLDHLLSTVLHDSDDNAWLLRVDQPLWELLRHLTPIEDVFQHVAQLQPQSPDELQRALLSRHEMSGFSLELDSRPRRLSLGGSSRQQQRWFRSLHKASHGLIRDALLLWLAAARRVDETGRVVTLGDVPRLPMDLLNTLPDQALLTLRQLAIYGWLDEAAHDHLFGMGLQRSRAHLQRLRTTGLLHISSGGYRIEPHLRGSVVRCLEGRGWL